MLQFIYLFSLLQKKKYYFTTRVAIVHDEVFLSIYANTHYKIEQCVYC